jgi:putative PEP-CTERM system TPR-repeat lipoprotein
LREVLALEDPLATSGGTARAPQPGSAEARALAAWRTQRALARAALGERDTAEAELRAALALDPDQAQARLLQARLLARAGDLDAAARTVDAVLAAHPDEADALRARAALAQARGEREAAIASLRRLLALRPADVGAHLALIDGALQRDDLAGARAQLDAMRQARPGHPATWLADARVALAQDDLTKTEAAIQQLQKAIPNDPRMLLLAGVLAQRRGEWAPAEGYFGQVAARLPQAPEPRWALAEIALRRGDPAAAQAALAPLLEGAAAAEADARTLTLAGTARLLGGDAAGAEALYARALRQRPDAAPIRTARALARLERGEAGALAELEAVARADAGSAADRALVQRHMAQRDAAAALAATERWATKAPRSAEPLYWRGAVLLARGDAAGARAAFEQALVLEPGYRPARRTLAELALRGRDLDAARRQVDAMLKADPKDPAALLVQARVAAAAARPPAEVGAMLGEAIAAQPRDLALRRGLIAHHFEQGRLADALAAAQATAAALPEDPGALDLVARTQLAAGEPHQAAATYARLATLMPKSAEPLVGQSAAQLAAGDADAAAASAKKAVSLMPGHPLGHRRAVDALLAARRFAEADALARGYAQRYPNQALGPELVGDVAHRRGQSAEAVRAYREALRLQPDGGVAAKLYAAWVDTAPAGTRAPPEAEAFAAGWLREHPRDVTFMLQRAQQAAVAQDWQAAEARYRAVLQLAPDEPDALNNLAWMLVQQKKPGAIDLAARASTLRPDRAAYLDTLAAAQAASGDLAQALETQHRAVAREPETMPRRVTLARLYQKAGQWDAARTELERVAAQDKDPAARNEALKLLGRSPG